MQPQTIQDLIQSGMPDAHVEVIGDGHHFEALIVSEDFAGLSPVRRHQKVYQVLGDKMRAEIHALSMRTLTPNEWKP